MQSRSLILSVGAWISPLLGSCLTNGRLYAKWRGQNVEPMIRLRPCKECDRTSALIYVKRKGSHYYNTVDYLTKYQEVTLL